jgi:hypothetical protein
VLRCIKVLLLLYLLVRAGHCADWRANGAGPVCAVPDEQPDVATSNVRGAADRPGAGGRPLPLARAIRATRTPIGSGASSPRLPRAGGVMGSTTGDGR